MHYALVCISRKNFNNFLFPASWTRYSAFSVILDQELCSRTNDFDKLLLRTTACMLQQMVAVKCKLMATLKMTIPKSGGPFFLAHGFYNTRRSCISSNCVSQFKLQSQERAEAHRS